MATQKPRGGKLRNEEVVNAVNWQRKESSTWEGDFNNKDLDKDNEGETKEGGYLVSKITFLEGREIWAEN